MKNPVIAERLETWIKALRSGDYKQCKLAIHVDENGKECYPETSVSHCCLGVAEMLMPVSIIEPCIKEDLEGPNYCAISDYFGLMGRDMSKLVDMNDNCGKSFAQIADYITENILPRYE